jgi:hypothetical protein
MYIPNPDFYPSRIWDPRLRIPNLEFRIQQRQQKRRRKNLLSYPDPGSKLFCFWTGQEKNFDPIHKDLLYFLPQNLSLSSKNSGFGIQDPESRGQKGTGSPIRIRNIVSDMN